MYSFTDIFIYNHVFAHIFIQISYESMLSFGYNIFHHIN